MSFNILECVRDWISCFFDSFDITACHLCIPMSEWVFCYDCCCCLASFVVCLCSQSVKNTVVWRVGFDSLWKCPLSSFPPLFLVFLSVFLQFPCSSPAFLHGCPCSHLSLTLLTSCLPSCPSLSTFLSHFPKLHYLSFPSLVSSFPGQHPSLPLSL